jgi:hypothetical protein
LFVLFQHALNSGFIPPGQKSVSFHRCQYRKERVRASSSSPSEYWLKLCC